MMIKAEQLTYIKENFPIQGMNCASCAVSIESYLKNKEGISELSVNLATNTLSISYAPESVSPQQIRTWLREIGFDLLLEVKSSERLAEVQQQNVDILRKKAFGATLLALPVFVLSMFLVNSVPFAHGISALLTTGIVFLYGKDFYQRAWKKARHYQANMDTLIALGTGSAYLFSLWNLFFPQILEHSGAHALIYFESVAVIIAFILIGKYLEERAKLQSGEAIQKLMELQPSRARVLRNGEEMEVFLSELKVFDRVLVRAFEKIPVDGKIIKGESALDESMINGESLPVFKSKGEPVFAGTLNQDGNLVLLAEKIGKDTVIAQITRIVQEAQNSKAPAQQLADRVAGIFVPAVLLIALSTFGLWLLWGGLAYWSQAFISLVSILVIACPCALGLATPTAIMVSIGRAAEEGILVRDAESLEVLHQVDTLIFDKTGTLTIGKPRVQSLYWFAKQEDIQTLEKYLFMLASQSGHPLSQAIQLYLREKNNTTAIEDVKDFPGKGISAWMNEQVFYLGSEIFILENGQHISPDIQNQVRIYQKEAYSMVYFAREGEVKALIALQDQVRDNAAVRISEWKKSGKKLFILSGDRPEVTEAIAKQVGIQDFQGGLLPWDKSAFVTQLKNKGAKVAMIGDGVNDAEALVKADVGVAMGKGTDIARQVAGITLMQSDLSALSSAIFLSRATSRTIKQNLFWAFFYNLLCIPIAAGILFPFNGFLLNPMLAGAAMALSSVTVVANSLRLKRLKINHH